MGGTMNNKEGVLSQRHKAFSERLRTEHSEAPPARAVLDIEQDLGTGAVAFQLSQSGKRLLFRAADLERKAKLRAAKAGQN